jgi:transposase
VAVVDDQELLFQDLAVSEGPARRPHVRDRLVFRKAPYSSLQPQVLPSTVDEMIAEDDPVRAYKVMLNALGFEALLDTYFPFGGVGYDPRVLAAVWLFGSTDGVHATRELEKRCKYDVRYWYLTDGQRPDYTTLSRFRVRLMSVGDEFFGQTIALARELGLGFSGAVAVDGRKTAGALDQWRTLRKDATDEELAAVSDSEARTLWCTRSGYVNGYSCVVGVDTQDDIVVGACASQESSDNKALGQFLEAIELQSPELPPAMVMDAGFSGSDCAGQLHDKEIEAFISQKEEPFWDLDADGEVICPVGHRLVKVIQKKPRSDGRQEYRIRQCRQCPLKELCATKSYKRITVQGGQDPRHLVRAMVLSQTPEGRARLAYRRGSIERLFAQLFYHQRFRRFTLRGLAGAKIQLLILCAAHNLWVVAARLFQLLGREGVTDLASSILGFLRGLYTLLRDHTIASERGKAAPQLVALSMMH